MCPSDIFASFIHADTYMIVTIDEYLKTDSNLLNLLCHLSIRTALEALLNLVINVFV